MKCLLIGDVHCRPNDIPECENLIKYILAIVKEFKVDIVIFEGDQFHHHNLAHCTVLKFWQDSIEKLSKISKVYLIKGNHDGDLDKWEAHGLIGFKNIATVVDDLENPVQIPGAILLPYCNYNDFDKFVEVCNRYSNVKTLICHMEFEGAQYENGYFTKHGLDQNLLPQKQIISGHIHTRNKLGKVFYTGSPRWLTVSDSNIDKFIDLYEISENGFELTNSFPTNVCCTQFFQIKIDENNLFLFKDYNPKGKYTIDIHGSKSFIEEQKKNFSGLENIRIRTFPIKEKKILVKESEGIKNSFFKYLNNIEFKYNTPKEKLLQIAKQNISWI